MNWLWFIPILLIMVVIHEMGHFLTARFFGMKVHEFGIGFPPKVWSKKTKDGMEWSVNLLPIGGFVRIDGENGDSDDPNSFGAKPTWQRAIVLSAGPAMNIILALLLYFAVTFFGGKDVENGRPAVVDVAPNSPAAAAGLLPGDIFVSINNKAVQTATDISIETALDKNNPVQLILERNGQQVKASVLPRKNPPEGEGAMGVVLGNAVGSDQIMIGATASLNKQLGLSGPDAFQDKDKIVSVDGQTFATNLALLNYLRTTSKSSVSVTVQRDGRTITHDIPLQARVDLVYKDSSAASQNLPLGAIITRVNDTPVSNAAQYNQAITANLGKEMTLYYKTSPDSAETPLVLLADTSLNPTAANRAPRVSNASFAIVRPFTHETYGPVAAAGEAWNQTVFAITLIPRTFKGLFDGSVAVSNLAGPIGMAQITDQVVTQSTENGGIFGLLSTLAVLMALLSVNLGVINILPLPALDGGRLVFVIIEMVTRGRRVPPEKESLVHFAGMVALLSLMLLIAWQDVVRLVGGGGFN
jgi:regulator of sigma E protease